MEASATMHLVARTLVVAGLGLGLGLVGGCFRGGEREKEAPAGLLGGKCLAPPSQGASPFCEEGLCNEMRNYCYDPMDPCEGFFCGGSDRGFCQPDAELLPSCICDIGYNTETFDLYCCPDPGSPVIDPRCNGGDGDGGDGEADVGGDASMTDETGAGGSDGAGSGTG